MRFLGSGGSLEELFEELFKTSCDGDKPPRKKRKKRPRRSKVMSPRLRVRGDAEEYICTRVHPQASPLPYVETLFREHMAPVYECIVDTKGFLQKWQNPCNHTTVRSTLKEPSVQYGPAGALTGPIGGEKLNPRAMLTHLPYPSDVLLEDLSAQAVENLSKVHDSTANIAGSILEILTDVKSGLEKAYRVSKLWAQAMQNFREGLPALLEGLSDPAEQYAKTMLFLRFCLEPIASDVKDLLCSVHRARKRLKWLIRHNNVDTRVFTRRFNVYETPSEMKEIIVGGPGYYYSGPWIPGVGGSMPLTEDIPAHYVAREEYYVCDFKAQAVARFHIPLYKLNVTDLWLADMGFQAPFAAMWEAVPFSFLIDWFTDCFTSLNSILDDKVDPYGTATLLECGHSLTIKARYGIYCVNTWNSSEEYLGHITVRRYMRAEGLPDQVKLRAPLSLPSGEQAEVGAALAYTMTGGVKRRKRVRRARR